MTLRFLTSGESHGRGYLTVLEGFPSGLEVPLERLRGELARRRRGYGRGARMTLERDVLTPWGGLRGGRTTGAPLGFVLENTEWEQWRPVLDPEDVDPEQAEARGVYRPRPGHGDLTGCLKYGHRDARNVLERASARSTAAWTLAGTVARLLLEGLGVRVRGAVTALGGVEVPPPREEDQWLRAGGTDLGAPREEDEIPWRRRVDQARERGQTLGGVFLVSAQGLPPGLGSYAEWDRRLDGRLAGALMALPGIKGVEVGDGFALASREGGQAHDEIQPEGSGIRRRTNRAGGLEGGMTNGEEVLLRCAMKPIPTLASPLGTLDLRTGEAAVAQVERGDLCAVPAACVVAEALTAWVLACAVVECCGGDRMEELTARFEGLRQRGRRER